MSVEVATVPEGVTLAGAKEQLPPVGSPEQVNVVAEAKPFCGVTEIVTSPLCPYGTESEGCETANAKFGGRLMMYAAEATALLA